MSVIRRSVMVVGVLALGPAALYAQAKPEPAKTEHAAGPATLKTSQMTGEVVQVEGNALAVKMQPAGQIRVFNVQPGRTFMIDGQTKAVGDLKAGTVLTATITTKTQDLRVRTMEVVHGTVWYVSGNTVILTLENGETRSYNVPEAFKFSVDGKEQTVRELKKGTKVVASKLVEEPETVISTDVVVTGKAPK